MGCCTGRVCTRNGWCKGFLTTCAAWSKGFLTMCHHHTIRDSLQVMDSLAHCEWHHSVEFIESLNAWHNRIPTNSAIPCHFPYHYLDLLHCCKHDVLHACCLSLVQDEDTRTMEVHGLQSMTFDGYDVVPYL